MFKVTSFLAVLALCVGSMTAAAADKVVVFNFEKAILSTEAAKRANSELTSNPEFASLQAKFEGLVADLDKLREEQKSKGITWDAVQQAEHRKKVEYLRADIELAQKKLQAEQQAVIRGLVSQYEDKTREALKQIIDAEGITVVLNASEVYYATPESDITARVVEALNKAE